MAQSLSQQVADSWCDFRSCLGSGRGLPWPAEHLGSFWVVAGPGSFRLLAREENQMGSFRPGLATSFPTSRASSECCPKTVTSAVALSPRGLCPGPEAGTHIPTVLRGGEGNLLSPRPLDVAVGFLRHRGRKGGARVSLTIPRS